MTASQPTPKPTQANFLTALKGAISAEPPARAKILNGAIKVLRKKDLAHCTVEDLLQAGGVSRGSFYQYFQSKYDVAAALLMHIQQQIIERTRQASTGERRPFVRLQNAFDVYLDTQVSAGWLYAMLLGEAKRPDSPLVPARLKLLETMTQLINRTFHFIQHRSIDPDVFRTLLLAIEELTLHIHQRGNFTSADADHIRAIMLPIIQRTLAHSGEALLPLPQGTELPSDPFIIE